MDIRGFGDANVRKFYEMDLLKDIPGIYTLDFKKIAGKEGFGEKSISNLQQAISNSKKQPLHRLIYALGIRFCGRNYCKDIGTGGKSFA
jgi:DNA ligase (NAD+)